MLSRSLAAILRQGRGAAAAVGAAAGVAGRKYGSAATRLLISQPTGGSNWGAVALLAATAGCVALTPAALAAANDERSFIMVKPDGVHRGLVGNIIQRFERKGYKLVGIKVLVPTKDLASKHYAEHDGKPFFPKLVTFLSSGPVIAMVWEGKEVINYGRTLIGVTNPLASAPGTIRGDFGIDVGRNIIHGSDSTESAKQEIALWFHPDELTTYQPVATPWLYE